MAFWSSERELEKVVREKKADGQRVGRERADTANLKDKGQRRWRI